VSKLRGEAPALFVPWDFEAIARIAMLAARTPVGTSSLALGAAGMGGGTLFLR
jgi:hypothetical protein